MSKKNTISKKVYENELARLQLELIKLQSWIKQKNLKVIVIFEGRDAAGKGGTIKRITQALNPRVCKVVALPFHQSAKRHNGISSDILLISPQMVRWLSSTAVGITERVLKKL